MWREPKRLARRRGKRDMEGVVLSAGCGMRWCIEILRNGSGCLNVRGHLIFLYHVFLRIFTSIATYTDIPPSQSATMDCRRREQVLLLKQRNHDEVLIVNYHFYLCNAGLGEYYTTSQYHFDISNCFTAPHSPIRYHKQERSQDWPHDTLLWFLGHPTMSECQTPNFGLFNHNDQWCLASCQSMISYGARQTVILFYYIPRPTPSQRALLTGIGGWKTRCLCDVKLQRATMYTSKVFKGDLTRWWKCVGRS